MNSSSWNERVGRVYAAIFAALMILTAPAVVWAQAAIAGTVKDTSDALLPGVTVEAASPALIEKVRTAVTDGTGQYRIENLRPGQYTVTFTLPGFTTIRREGIELTGSFVASVNAELRVGAVAETVVVSGESPIVDVQSSQRTTVLTQETINAIPTAGSYNALLVLVPGLLGGQQDVSTGPCNSCTFSAHGTLLSLGGNRANTDARLLVDGISIAVPQAGGTNYLTDTRNAQEVTFTVSGSMGEVESGGPVMNIIPRSGGNTVSGNGSVGWANGDLQGSNLSDELRRLNVTASPLIKGYDVSGAVGGPIQRDRIWFFGTVRSQGSSSYIPSMYYNKNAGDPNRWLYEPDLTRQAFNDKTWRNASARFTMQVTPRNKVHVFWDEQKVCTKCENGGNYANATTSPEGNGYGDLHPMRFQQATWTSPVNNKLLLEGGFGYFFSRWGGRAKQDPYTGNLPRVIEQCAAGCPANGNIPGLMYRSQTTDLFSDGRNKNVTTTWRATAAYVTGGNALKFGYIGNQLGDLRSANRSPNDLRYRVNNGVPNQLTQYVHDQQNDLWMRNDGFYVQQQWTRGRLTLQGALRFDRAWSWAPEQRLESRFWAQPLVFDETPVVDSYTDLTPRAAVTYDLFGNGRTALKATLGKYLESTVTASNYGLGNPTSRIATNVFRTWTDRNSNWNPDCDLSNPQPQDFGPTGDFCGVINNLNFGTATFSNTIDPDILHGWGVRPSDWNWGVSVQHEVLPRTSVEVGFFHREFYGFAVTDNLAVTPADFSQFSITAPQDPRLPNGGGYQVGTLYDLNVPSLFGVTRNFITYADRYGDAYQKYNGIDVTISARPRNGLTFQGGFSGGYSTSDNCEVREKLPEIALLNPYCHIETSFLPQYKGIATYIVPRIDVSVSGTFTSKPGIQVSGFGTPVAGGAFAANYTISNALVQPILGRPLAGSAPNITVNLIEPHSVLGDRVNELNMRVGKVLRFGRSRANVGVDFYNLLNAATPLSYNQAFIPGGAWLTPTSVLSARFAKLSMQLDF
ncbi:MAG TPA: carboxypeptidase regulatory-like domain-containing protein [Vicinamibacterales bacterium]|nr:carboxypeptidase regulatory-like domain-containing protein [Vicinamibacterales bacterium]